MIIKGEKVNLRTVTETDAPRYVKWFRDPEVTRYLIVRNVTLQQEKKWIRENRKSRTDHVFAIETKDRVHIGGVGLHGDKGEKTATTFGIFIGEKEYWNQGLGSEATALILAYAFQKKKYHRVTLDVYEFNKRGIRVYEKMGFVHEGIKRKAVKRNGKYYDVIIMGMLRHEYKKKK